jgi:CelD/BcsL family acetyltransferase involved in cellulose biosynthesis
MQIEIFENGSAFEILKSEWNGLLRESATDSMFLSWEWQSAWWQTLGGGKACIITFRDPNGKLVGIAPMFWEDAQGGGVALSQMGCSVSDYLDVMVAKGHVDHVYTALIETLTGTDFPHWDAVNFCNLPEASPMNDQFRTMAEAHGLIADHRVQTVSPFIALPATWDEYLATLDKKQRHEVRRKLRRVEEVPTRWYIIERAEEIDEAVKDFVALHRKSSADKGAFMTSEMEGFFLEICRRLLPAGWLQLQFLEVEGVRAAAMLNFVYQNNVLVYNSGYDPEKYGQFSPGIILNAHSIQDAISSKRRVFDFLRGDEEYKYRFGAQNTNVYEMHLRHP